MRREPDLTTVDILSPGNAGIVARVLRPAGMDLSMWDLTLARLEELGLFPGERLSKISSFGPFGHVVLEVLGSKVAISKDLARLILVRREGMMLR